MDAIRRHVVVHGQVQGIGFRFSARVEAQRLGVSGWVRNRSDGAVEAEIEGEPPVIDAMLGWFDEGPPGASVTTMITSDLEPTGEHGFNVTF
jgi:acylphosphatase